MMVGQQQPRRDKEARPEPLGQYAWLWELDDPCDRPACVARSFVGSEHREIQRWPDLPLEQVWRHRGGGQGTTDALSLAREVASLPFCSVARSGSCR
jgi:hypothetical protein